MSNLSAQLPDTPRPAPATPAGAEASAGAITPPRVRASASVRTYRYLRLSLVGLVVLLLFCVWAERLGGAAANRNLGSISAYYYTPARSVFVGALVAIGISLVAIVGRRGFEDTALNIAGMLAPVVAFVPTPRGAGGAPCDPEGRCSVPPEFVPSVVNNVWGLIALGVLGLGLGAWIVIGRRQSSRATRIGFFLAAGVFVAFVLWFRFARDSFLDTAHFGAAVPLFGLITAVAFVNARHAARRRDGIPGREPSREAKSYRMTYAVTAGVMAVTFAVAIVLVVVDQFLGGGTPTEWVLWVEVVLLVAFAVFWVTQTFDYWNDGLPEEASTQPTAVGV
ncbi:hypothetical protein N798_13090 [Knoellia flava TL1]|uniref:DUF998 domain-containing protein n=2 Tax=Knoellia flava TaxID=913969 RepID=A0A8H9FUT1_9MICO|nr:hypothetical protein [Knoellia flava]KGN29609.1 hypothetical protein N798_13090 [Knoellia flava TL1]GGB76209.1 hypothetical protein GCM10011314_14710 [Knoellia flava]